MDLRCQPPESASYSQMTYTEDDYDTTQRPFGVNPYPDFLNINRSIDLERNRHQ